MEVAEEAGAAGAEGEEVGDVEVFGVGGEVYAGYLGSSRYEEGTRSEATMC